MQVAGARRGHSVQKLPTSVAADLAELLPAIAASCECVFASEGAQNDDPHDPNTTFDKLALELRADEARIQMYRILWLYSTLLSLTPVSVAYKWDEASEVPPPPPPRRRTLSLSLSVWLEMLSLPYCVSRFAILHTDNPCSPRGLGSSPSAHCHLYASPPGRERPRRARDACRHQDPFAEAWFYWQPWSCISGFGFSLENARKWPCSGRWAAYTDSKCLRYSYCRLAKTSPVIPKA